MQGYYNNPEATNDLIRKHKDGRRWIHTGDLGYINEDGVIFITGRIKRIIMTRGEDGQVTKFFPDRIEKVLYEHPTVDLCCVIGIPDEQRINCPKVFIVLKKEMDESEETTNSIIEFCKSKLPGYMVPDAIEYRNALPRTPRGKIDYRALEEAAQQE
jgi:long-chain acyl-CoA synthetase